MRKVSPDDDLSRSHWTSRVVICWKDRDYLPKALNEDTPRLCNIVSDTSHLKMKDFEKIAPWYNPWGHAYYIAKYKVKVIIEVADILFEVWCNGFKLSEDQRIDVQWKEGAESGRPTDTGRAKDILVR